MSGERTGPPRFRGAAWPAVGWTDEASGKPVTQWSASWTWHDIGGQLEREAAARDGAGRELAALGAPADAGPLGLAPGLSWPSEESRGRCLGADSGLRWSGLLEAEELLTDFWRRERASGHVGEPAGFGRRGERPAPPADSPRSQRCRSGASRWCWLPVGLPERRRATEAARAPSFEVPERVLEAEREVRLAIEADAENRERLARLGHAGPVSGLGAGGDLECASCGAVSSDEGLFAELGDGCGR